MVTHYYFLNFVFLTFYFNKFDDMNKTWNVNDNLPDIVFNVYSLETLSLHYTNGSYAVLYSLPNLHNVLLHINPIACHLIHIKDLSLFHHLDDDHQHLISLLEHLQQSLKSIDDNGEEISYEKNFLKTQLRALEKIQS